MSSISFLSIVNPEMLATPHIYYSKEIQQKFGVLGIEIELLQ
jgi:ASC-1-like (ASCH) protein